MGRGSSRCRGSGLALALLLLVVLLLLVLLLLLVVCHLGRHGFALDGGVLASRRRGGLGAGVRQGWKRQGRQLLQLLWVLLLLLLMVVMLRRMQFVSGAGRAVVVHAPRRRGWPGGRKRGQLGAAAIAATAGGVGR